MEKRIKLLKIAKELNVGMSTCVETLQKHGYSVDTNPNTRIGEAEIDILRQAYGKEIESTVTATRKLVECLYALSSELVDLYNLSTDSKAFLEVKNIFIENRCKCNRYVSWLSKRENNSEIVDLIKELLAGIDERVKHIFTPKMEVQGLSLIWKEDYKALRNNIDQDSSDTLEHNADLSKISEKNRDNTNNRKAKDITSVSKKDIIKLYSIIKVKIIEINESYFKVEVDHRDGIIKKRDMDSESLSRSLQIGDFIKAKIIAISDNTVVLSTKVLNQRIEIDPGKKNIYVIDTNIFLKEPNIIGKIPSEYSIVIPGPVLTELDYHKKDSDSKIKKNSIKAINNINNALTFSTRVITERFDKEFLPKDLDGRNNDDMILSIALKVRTQNTHPILFSDDIGIKVKAHAQDITSITLKEFLSQ